MPIEAVLFDAYGTLFDTNSVEPAVESACPGHGALVAQIWRLKQLEYSWLRTAMGAHADFGTVTREALVYALEAVGLPAPDDTVERLCRAFDALAPFPETATALGTLAGRRLAVLSNGSPAMLAALLGHAGLARHFEAVISTDAAGVFKPHPDAYAAAAQRLGVTPAALLLVSSNGFDIAGARRSGLRTARIARMPQERLQRSLGASSSFDPKTLYAALRSRPEAFGGAADHVHPSLGAFAEALVAGTA